LLREIRETDTQQFRVGVLASQSISNIIISAFFFSASLLDSLAFADGIAVKPMLAVIEIT
jgi:hypothetical protein